MPFKSRAQQKYLFARRPKLAQKWADKYGVPEDLPEHKSKKLYRKNKKGK